LEGRIDGRLCSFRIDTGSDVTILREKFLGFKRRILASNCPLRYPTRETVTVENKAIVKIEVGKFCLDFPVFITKIEDDCILGVDFLEQVKLGGIFTSAFKGRYTPSMVEKIDFFFWFFLMLEVSRISD